MLRFPAERIPNAITEEAFEWIVKRADIPRKHVAEFRRHLDFHVSAIDGSIRGQMMRLDLLRILEKRAKAHRAAAQLHRLTNPSMADLVKAFASGMLACSLPRSNPVPKHLRPDPDQEEMHLQLALQGLDLPYPDPVPSSSALAELNDEEASRFDAAIQFVKGTPDRGGRSRLEHLRRLIRGLIEFWEEELGREAAANGKFLDLVNEVCWAMGWDKDGTNATMVRRELHAYRNRSIEFVASNMMLEEEDEERQNLD